MNGTRTRSASTTTAPGTAPVRTSAVRTAPARPVALRPAPARALHVAARQGRQRPCPSTLRRSDLQVAARVTPLALVPPPAPAVRTHLTRRGRLLVTLTLAALLLAAFAFGRSAASAAPETAVPAPSAPVAARTTVQSGETLWGVARRIAPERDPRDVVSQIQRLNHMQGAGLRVGQQLLLPTAS